MDQAITVNTGEMLDVLKDNRTKHVAAFTQAREDYAETVRAELVKQLDQFDAGKFDPDADFRMNFSAPESHAADYDRTTAMLEMSIDDTVGLSEREFSKYVLDQWDWQQTFSGTVSAYALAPKRHR